MFRAKTNGHRREKNLLLSKALFSTSFQFLRTTPLCGGGAEVEAGKIYYVKKKLFFKRAENSISLPHPAKRRWRRRRFLGSENWSAPR
jgi:hypothetical protein